MTKTAAVDLTARHVDLSHNEMMSLVRLAARGVGYDWGIADEAASAYRWLAARGWPVGQWLDELFTLHDGAPHGQLRPVIEASDWASVRAGDGGHLCPLYTGAALIDFTAVHLPSLPLKLHNVAQPLLLLPFAARASRFADVSLYLELEGMRHTFLSGRHIYLSNAADGEGYASDAPLLSGLPVMSTVVHGVERARADTDASKDEVAGAGGHVCQRIEIEEDCLLRLKSLAARTYAPATEQSRLLGAGAGVSDND